MNILHDEALVTAKEAANMLHIDYQTLNSWRARRSQPLNYVKIGHLVCYKIKDIQKFIRGNTVEVAPSSEINHAKVLKVSKEAAKND